MKKWNLICNLGGGIPHSICMAKPKLDDEYARMNKSFENVGFAWKFIENDRYRMPMANFGIFWNCKMSPLGFDNNQCNEELD